MLPDIVYFGNSVSAYAFAIGIFAGGLAITTVIHRYAFKRLQRWAISHTSSLTHRVLEQFNRSTKYLLYLISFWIGISSLELSDFAHDTIRMSTTGLATLIMVQLITLVLESGIRYYWVTHRRNETFEASFNALIPALRALVWSMAIIFLLDNFGFNISAVVASLEGV